VGGKVRVSVLGKRWNLRFVPNLSKSGDCDGPSKEGKEIRIWQGVKGKDKLDTLIHELLHAAGWHIDEAFVAQFASDAAQVLWRLGYREEN
jgi:hypothetical protein